MNGNKAIVQLLKQSCYVSAPYEHVIGNLLDCDYKARKTF